MATYWENSCSFGLRYVSWYKYLIVSLVFSHLGFWSGNLFLIAPFPDLCLLVPFHQFGLVSEKYMDLLILNEPIRRHDFLQSHNKLSYQFMKKISWIFAQMIKFSALKLFQPQR